MTEAEQFIRESNKIEGIFRDPTEEERQEYYRFMELQTVSVADLETFVSVYQPGKKLRRRAGMDVRVGNHIPPGGGPSIEPALKQIVEDANEARHCLDRRLRERIAYETHVAYETLHPFMDGNGRSGRMLWAWCVQRHPLGFLHHWYYQTLQFRDRHLAPPV